MDCPQGLVPAASAAAAAATTAGSAASAAKSAASAATAAATAAATLFTGLGLVDGQGPSAEVLAVEGGDRRLGFRIGTHLNKAEPAAATGHLVLDHLCV